jgi:hypothetical protein
MLAALMMAGSAHAKSETLRDWTFTFTPYAWIPVIQGSVKINDNELPIDVSVTDLLKKSDRTGVFMGALEIRYKKFSVYGDSTYLSLGFDKQPLPILALELKTDLEFIFVDFGLTYRVLEGKPGTVQPWTIDLLAGGRYSSQEYKLALTGLPGKIKVDKSWVDPIIGGRVTLDMTRRWRFILHADVGGFGVGSDISAQGKGTIGYRWFPGNFELELAGGYRALYQNVNLGGGISALDYDATVHGPILRFDIAY